MTDEMVEKQNASYRHRYGKEVPGEVSDEESHITGKLVELDEAGNEKADGIVMERAAISPKYDIKDEEAKPQFVGLKVGDSIVFNPHKATGGSEVLLASILGVDKEVAATATADFRFTVTEILVNQDAEMDQELFNAVLGNGVATTEEDYLAKVREMIAGQLKNDSNYRFTIDAREAITAAVGELEMPADFLKRFLLSRPDNEVLVTGISLLLFNITSLQEYFAERRTIKAQLAALKAQQDAAATAVVTDEPEKPAAATEEETEA